MIGIKYDEGKVRLDLIDPKMILALGDVLTFGAKKHGENTWQGIEINRYESALMRHLMAYKGGELRDSDSGLPHLYHVLCNAAFMVCLNERQAMLAQEDSEPRAEKQDMALWALKPASMEIKEKTLAPHLADGINHAQTTETKGLVFSGEKDGKVLCKRYEPGAKLFVNGKMVFNSISWPK